MNEKAANIVPLKRFYVYALKAGDRVVYVGKGTGSRALQHLARSHNARVNELLDGADEKISIDVLSWHSSDTEATKEEARVIALYPDSELLNASMATRKRSPRASLPPAGSEMLAAHVRLQAAEHAELKYQAREVEGVTLAVYLRQLIREALDARRENGNGARG